MTLPGGEWIPPPNQNSMSTKLISNDIKADLVAAVARDVPLGDRASRPGGGLKVITAYYDLAQADNRILVEWLIQCNAKKPGTLRQTLIGLLTRTIFRTHDVRYTLA